MIGKNLPISLITYGDCGGKPIYFSGVTIDSILYTSPSGERGLVFFAISRKDPTGVPPFIAMSTSSSEIPAGLEAYLNNNYILAVVSQDLKISDVPQGAQYAMLMANGASSGLRRIEQLNSQFTSSVLNGVGYQLLSIPGGGTGYEETSTPLGVCLFDNKQQQTGYAITSGPSPIMTALLVPTDVGGTILYSPAAL